MKEQFRVAQKIGLMFRPDDDIPTDINSWALEQLKLKTQPVGIANKRSSVKPWPNELMPDLADRVLRIHTWNAKRKKIQKDKSLSKKQRKEKRRLLNKKYHMSHTDELKFAHRNVYGEDQIRQRFTLFWLNHFTIGQSFSSHQVIGHYIEEAIYANLNGPFNEMLYKVTSHPAMLSYLDNIFNTGQNSPRAKMCAKKPNGCKIAFGLNDNLARELMELHTVSPKAGYSEKDIRAAANVLAGWGVTLLSEKLKNFGLTESDHWDAYIEQRAEPSSQVVMGKKIESGKGGLRELTDYLASLDYTAEFLSTKLCQHFVSDNPNSNDIDYVKSKWINSNGDLDQVHAAVIERAIKSNDEKFQWPITWLFQVVRLSGATFFRGWEDISKKQPKAVKSSFQMQAEKVFTELGQSFWVSRQPDGYSSQKSEWLSGEYFERRLRFADAIYSTGSPKHSAEEIMDRIEADDNTRRLVNSVNGDRKKFIALMCSPELMGVSHG